MDLNMELYIDFMNRTRKYGREEIDAVKELVRKALTAALEYEKVSWPCAVSVTFVSDRTIKRLNREYRGKDAATDVLSFPQAEDGRLDDTFDGERYELGDIVISLERAAAQADLYGHPFEREVAFLSVHSMLHLLGYDHERGETEDTDMRRRQREILASIGEAVK